MGSIQENKLDVLIVGAGFSGCFALKELTNLGLKCKAFEAAPEAGGVWYWNCYPGARVDTNVPLYQFGGEEIWKEWNWKQNYPDRDELVAYFRHVLKVWGVRDQVQFNTRVNSAHWESKNSAWKVDMVNNDGVKETYHSRYVVMCTGFAARPYVPPYEGVDDFEGVIYHSSLWPQEGVDLRNKKVAVIGTGASGVQAVQEVGKIAAHLTVFQRTPNLALPMLNPTFDTKGNDDIKKNLLEFMKTREGSFGGFDYEFLPQNTADVSAEERARTYETLFGKGGGNFWLGNYQDLLADQEANDKAYEFWRQKALARIKDPEKAKVLAPQVAPHPFGTKRVSLELDYFEICDQENVEIVSLKDTPIEKLVPNGIKTTDGRIHECDALIMATGFDSITGGLTQMDIRGASGQSLAEKWSNGVYSLLGMTVHDFPNLFYLYGPQAPTAFAIGPVMAELQGRWLAHTLQYLRENGLLTIEATKEAEQEWRDQVIWIGNQGLLSKADSWYFGANIPGKPRESLNYVAGLPAYKKSLWDAIDNGFKGFELK